MSLLNDVQSFKDGNEVSVTNILTAII